jgi:acyl-CoA hydrolase
MAAKIDFPEYNLVTRAMSEVEFRKSITNGSILQFNVEQERLGNTSVTYRVEVFSFPPEEKGGELVFETKVTFVAIDENSEKIKLR